MAVYDELPALEEELALPNAVDLLMVIHGHLVANYRDGVPPDVNFPSQWRMAKYVVSEPGPLALYRSQGAR